MASKANVARQRKSVPDEASVASVTIAASVASVTIAASVASVAR